jgi:putative DNA primase/helicase
MPRHFVNPSEFVLGYILDHHTVDAPQQSWETFSVKAPTLLFHQGVFYAWNGQCWEVFPDEALREALIKYAPQHNVGWAKVVTPKEISQVIQTFVGHIRQAQPAPCWRPDPNFDVKDLVACTNVTVSTRDGNLMQNDPRLFIVWGVEYEFDPHAQCPEFDKFLISIWGEEEQIGEDANGDPIMAKQGEPGTRQATLEEVFGYIMSGDKSRHKIVNFIGPAGSGKGTLGRLLGNLVGGDHNVASCTLQEIGELHGKESLIDKPLWISPDVKLPPKFFEEKMPQVLQALLSISGDDRQSVPRKYLKAWHGTLPTNIVVLSNAPLIINDPSRAWIRRVLMFRFDRDFEGREDRELDEKLRRELPGILNRALAGRKRLTARGEFIQPYTSFTMLADLARISAPVMEFVSECDTSDQARFAPEAVYNEFRRFCRRHGHKQMPRNLFCGQLYSARPGLELKQEPRPSRVRLYHGLGLGSSGSADRVQVKKVWFKDWQKFQPITAKHIHDDVHGALRATLGVYAGSPSYLGADIIEECLIGMKDHNDEGYVLRQAGKDQNGEALWEVIYAPQPVVVPFPAAASGSTT